MKRLSRLTALLLAIMLSLSMIPAALADVTVEVDSAVYNEYAMRAHGAELLEELLAITDVYELADRVDALSDLDRECIEMVATEEQIAQIDALLATWVSRDGDLPADFWSVPGGPASNFTNVAKFAAEEAAPVAMFAMARSVTRESDSTIVSPEGLVMNKTVTPKTDGTYTIDLEAYTTGTVTSTTTTKPTDIVLVLDMSGSMTEDYTSSQAGYVKATTNNECYQNSSSLYVLQADGSYRKVAVTVTREGSWLYGYNVYTYSYEDGTVIGTSNDSDGVPPTDIYIYYSSPGNRITALKLAVSSFLDTVAAQNAEITDDDEKHRVAYVKFAGSKSDTVGNDTNWGSNYSQIVKKLTTDLSSVNAAVQATEAMGATSVDYGLEHAKTVLRDSSSDRNKVVVVFTDGEPNHYSGFDTTVANTAIGLAGDLKDAGVTVFSVCIANGAAVNAGETLPYGNTNINRYMHLVSSNYPYAENMSTPGTGNTGSVDNDGTIRGYYLTPTNAGGLSSVFQQIASQIGSTTQQLGSDTVIKDIVSSYFTLPEGADENAITVTTQDATYSNGVLGWTDSTISNFNPTIVVEGKAVDVNGFDFKHNFVAENGRIEGDATKAGNFHGRKLIISFTVKPEVGFLGGEGVPTNGNDSGIYNADGTLVGNFNRPTVSVPVKPLVVTAAEKNVYLLDAPTEAELLVGAKVEAVDAYGNKYDINSLEDWQKKYVVIDGPTATVDEGTTMPMVEDGQYRVSASINGGTDDSSKQATTSAPAKINVFKPVLTFKDGVVPYMAKFPADDALTLNDYVSADTAWKHGDTVANPKTMGAAPTIKGITYSAASGVTNGGDVNAVDLVPVEVERITVTNGDEVMLIYSTNASDAIGTSHVTFIRAKCDHAGCSNSEVSTHLGNEDAPEFVLHVINVVGNLTITKSGLNVNTYAKTSEYSDYESAIFTVSGDYDGDGKEDIFTVVIPCPDGSGSVTLTGLRVGVYTVTEQTGWTWRYGTSTIKDSYVVADGSTASDGVVKVEGNKTAKVECVNSGHTDKWLGGDNYATNVFGASN